MTSENAAASVASNKNAGQTPTGHEPENSPTKHGARPSQPKTQASTSTAPNADVSSANTNEPTNDSKPSQPKPNASDIFSGTWAAMTPDEEKMYRRLAKRHKLIRLHGAKAAEMLAEEEAQRERRNEWVRKNNLACFKCGHHAGEWVAGGRRANGSLWVACKCIWRKPRAAGVPPAVENPANTDV